MVWQRSALTSALAALVLGSSAAPAFAQSPVATLAISGMTVPALWVREASEGARSTAGAAPVATTVGQRVFLPDAPVGLAVSAVRPVRSGAAVRPERSAAAPPQAQDSGDGFPWLQVGIGAAVGALFIQAVATANSGDSAELPRGGIAVVLPSS
jgi:hypothetical protein